MLYHPRAGQRATQIDLINVAQLTSQYYVLQPNPFDKDQMIKFGTSGHRGSAMHCNFNESHILAISQAIVEQRSYNKITGPCYVGKDTHALSEPAFISVLEVLTANKIKVIIEKGHGYTPTSSISCSIINHNRHARSQADGIIITPSHNPPEYGGIKYNAPHGGPADIYTTHMIETIANKFLMNNLHGIKRITIKQAWQSGLIYIKDLAQEYINNLSNIINMQVIQKSKLKLGVHPLGGAGINYWQQIAKFYKLNLTVVNDSIDQTFRFMHLDYDGKIRIDCSSKFAMASLLSIRNNFDVLFANDPDHDRHSIITPYGLMYPNQYLAVAINYLFQNRPNWHKNIAIGKTFVSSNMIDKVVNNLHRKIIETPVGFKWFVKYLINGNVGFCCEESAGAVFLCFDRSVWSTDKDGIIMCLLAAEITAVSGKNPQKHYDLLVKKLGYTSYNRIQFNIDNKKNINDKLLSETFNSNTLAGDCIIKKLTTISINNTIVDVIKIITDNGWFAIRSSGTENNYKIYCESFINTEHRKIIESEAINFVNTML